MSILPAFSSRLVPVVHDPCFVAEIPVHQPQVLSDLTDYLIPSMNFLLDASENTVTFVTSSKQSTYVWNCDKEAKG